MRTFGFRPNQRLSVFVIFTWIFLVAPALDLFECLAQIPRSNPVEFIKFSDSSQPIVDLTSQVKDSCGAVIAKDIGAVRLSVHFQPSYRERAETAANMLMAVIRETQKLLHPLTPPDVKLYLLQVDKVPINYKMREISGGKPFYVSLWLFRGTEELDLTKCHPRGFCSEIFSVTPHELTHPVLENLITRKQTRWFDDGLAEYVSNSILERFNPTELRIKLRSYVPEMSLHRQDIRENIFAWREAGVGFFKISQRDLSNEIYYYGASYELVRQVVERAKRNGVEAPLEVLLRGLKELRERSGAPVSTSDIISIMESKLKINPKTFGDLDSNRQKAFWDEAISLLSGSEVSDDDKKYALYIFAALDRAPLTREWLGYLMDIVYKSEDADTIRRELAASALTVRFKQAGFDDALRNYLSSSNPKVKGKSVREVKQKLVSMSLIPTPD
ncbi:MAG: hypothetical protein ACK4S4_07265 [Pyrinomonadaceae bacterium]